MQPEINLLKALSPQTGEEYPTEEKCPSHRELHQFVQEQRIPDEIRDKKVVAHKILETAAPTKTQHQEPPSEGCPEYGELCGFMEGQRISDEIRDRIATHLPNCVRCTNSCRLHKSVQISDATRARIAAHLPNCVKCTKRRTSIDEIETEGAVLVHINTLQGHPLVEFATTIENKDFILSHLVYRCSELLNADPTDQYAIQTLNVLLESKKLPPDVIVTVAKFAIHCATVHAKKPGFIHRLDDLHEKIAIAMEEGRFTVVLTQREIRTARQAERCEECRKYLELGMKSEGGTLPQDFWSNLTSRPSK